MASPEHWTFGICGPRVNDSWVYDSREIPAKLSAVFKFAMSKDHSRSWFSAPLSLQNGFDVSFPFPNKPWFLHICSTSLLKTLWEKYKLLITSSLSFSHSVFSSPEHKVLMVSFCDRPMSVVHNFFKHLLLLNHWANLDETWQGCSLGEALPNLFKRLNSNHNFGCHGNQNEKNSKIFLKIFSEIRRHRALIFGM